MVLIDTSAWIASFHREGFTRIKSAVMQALDKQEAVTAGIVVLELLRGSRNEEQRQFLRTRFRSVAYIEMTRETWEEAGDLGRMMASKGLHIPSTDLALAALAIQHRCTLLHIDQHYELLAKHTPLKQWSVN